MAAFPPKDKTVDRRPSLSGVLMQDVTHGVERSRAWPQKRGKKLDPVTKDQNDLFRQYQWATKYWDPKLYIQAMNAVKGTPLLPRDIMTMIMSGRLCSIRMVDGKVWYPMAALQDVSQSLDVITQTPGRSIIRGAELWEEWVPPSGTGQWDLIYANAAITNPTPNIDVNITGYSDVMVIGRLVTLASSAFRGVYFSTDDGATFPDTNGAFVQTDTNGIEASTFLTMNHGTASTLARTFGGFLFGANIPGVPKVTRLLTNVVPNRLFVASTDVITHLRIAGRAASGGALVNMTGGQAYVFAR